MQTDTALPAKGITYLAPNAALRGRTALLVVVVLGPLLLQGYSFLRYGLTIRLVDEYFYHAHARSWYFDHDYDYENDLLMAPGFGAAPFYVDMRSPTGRVANNFFTGTSLISLPFIALADGLTMTHNALATDPLPRDGYSAYYQFVVACGHTLVGIAGLLTCYVLCARYFAPQLSALAVLCVWLGTNAVYYVGYESPQSHASSLALVALVFLIADTVRRDGLTLPRMIALGLCCGMMVATRPQDVVWVVVPTTVLVTQMFREGRDGRRNGRQVALIAVAAIVATVCYVPQALVNIELFGTPVFNTYSSIIEDGKPQLLHWTSPDFVEALIDRHVGLLWTAPVAVLSMIGIGGLLFRRSLLLTAVAIGFGSMYYVIACIWWLITGYGHRYFVSCSAAFALGLCVVFTWAAARRLRTTLVATVVTICLLWQVGLLASTNFGYRKPTDISPIFRVLDSP